MEETLKTFHTVCSFVKELKDLFGKKYYNITLYNRILEKTPITHQSAIFKHIEIFREFCQKNKDGILNKDIGKLKWDKIMFSNKIYINIKDVLNDADNDTKNSIWKYLLAISFSTIQTDDLKDKIKEILSDSSNAAESAGENEKEFINSFISKIENSFKDKDFKDPMSATANLLQSGIFTDMVKTMDDDIKTGKINVNKLLGSVQGMLGNISSDIGGNGGGMPDLGNMFGMINGMMSGQMPAEGGMGGLGGLASLFAGMGMNGSESTPNVEEIPALEELLKPITNESNETGKKE
jgi:hypothetical protein